MRYLVAAGVAALVMGLGGNLYATSYTTSDRCDSGAAPAWGSTQIDFKSDFLSSDHASYRRAVAAVVMDHFRQIAAREAKEMKRIGNADRSRLWDHRTWTQTVPSVAVVEPVTPPVTVPDGGATVLMLGGALCGLAVLRRNLVA